MHLSWNEINKWAAFSDAIRFKPINDATIEHARKLYHLTIISNGSLIFQGNMQGISFPHPDTTAIYLCKMCPDSSGKLAVKGVSNQITFIDLVSSENYYR